MTREEIDRLREAFVAGARWWNGAPNLRIEEQAAKRFPYPAQPRVVAVPGYDGYRARFANGRIELCREPCGSWYSPSCTEYSPAFIRAFADLLDHPNEEAS